MEAAYIGAANRNDPVFYELACSALSGLFGPTASCTSIRTDMDVQQHRSNLVILAGGSVTLGLEFMQRPVVAQWLRQIHADPHAAFIGLSAGAIHLGRGCDPDSSAPVAEAYLDWFPHFVAVHEAQLGWPSQRIWEEGGRSGQFVGIPLGGGVWQAGNDRQLLGNPAIVVV